MPVSYDVIVVGAGPAGTSTAIELARAGVRVCVFDKDEFPRHKLCGEFLSGEGTDWLRRHRLDTPLLRQCAVPITRCMVSSAAGALFEASLPGNPLSISRFALDRIMLGEAERAGAHVETGSEVTGVSGSLADGFHVVLRNGANRHARVVVCAFGRTSGLERTLDRSLLNPDANPLVAFKAHYEGRFDDGIVELHGFDGGYCGIQRVEEGRVNVCWITRAATLQEAGGKPDDMVATVFEQNRLLKRRLSVLERANDGFLAVSQLNLRPRAAVEGDLLMAGDSAGMIAPMCGDGMSMAISSGALVARLVEAFLADRLDASSMKSEYHRRWRRSFRQRMWIGRLLHAGYERAPVSHAGLRICERFPAVGNWLIRATRG